MSSSRHLPLSQALCWILVSTFVVSGASLFFYFFYFKTLNERLHDPAYHLLAIIQTCPEKEALKTDYLAEILDLSVDKPVNLFGLELNSINKKLLSCPQIKRVNVKKLFPNTLFIDYSLREPVAFLGECTNTVIDKEGISFPFHPFYTPKNKPNFLLGIQSIQECTWGSKIKGIYIELAFQVLESIQHSLDIDISSIKTIDVSRAFSPSEGKREIILVIEDTLGSSFQGNSILFQYHHFLRLSSENYLEGLQKYKKLREYLLHNEMQKNSEHAIVRLPVLMIDLRIPQLAYLRTCSKKLSE